MLKLIDQVYLLSAFHPISAQILTNNDLQLKIKTFKSGFDKTEV